MKIINLCPHAVNIIDGPTFESDGCARVTTDDVKIRPINGISVHVTTYRDVIGLPEPQDGVVYIVSTIVRAALPHRLDLISPDSGPTARRDLAGRIIAVRGFMR